eukprot:6471935-Amphidinium_carterae.1
MTSALASKFWENATLPGALLDLVLAAWIRSRSSKKFRNELPRGTLNGILLHTLGVGTFSSHRACSAGDASNFSKKASLPKRLAPIF